MAIYEKSTKEIMHEFAAAVLKPGQIFTRNDAITWFAEHYPKTKPNTIRLHVAGMAVNAPSFRKNHPSIKPGAGYDLFYKIDAHNYRLWDRQTDPQPLYGDKVQTVPEVQVSPVDDDNDSVADEDRGAEQSKEFAYERDLKNYLAKNLASIEPGYDYIKRRVLRAWNIRSVGDLSISSL